MELEKKEDYDHVVLTIESNLQILDIVKNKPFVVVYRATDMQTQQPYSHRRLSLDFSIRGSNQDADIPRLVFYKTGRGYSDQITDKEGKIACTLTIVDISRRHDKNGLRIVAKVSETNETCISQAFKVISKKKKNQGPAEQKDLKRAYQEIEELKSQLESVQKRLKALEGK
jgi:hypothetical protein